MKKQTNNLRVIKSSQVCGYKSDKDMCDLGADLTVILKRLEYKNLNRSDWASDTILIKRIFKEIKQEIRKELKK